MTMQEITLAGKTYPLLYNGAAMFAAQELLGERNLVTTLTAQGTEGFDFLCKLTVLMAEQGELMRRYEGHKKAPFLKEEALRLLARPFDIIQIRNAALEAVAAGFRREVQEEETEVDLGLQELQKKKRTKTDSRPLPEIRP